MVLASRIKDDILLPQESQHPVDRPPEFLPQAVHCFLASACDLPMKPHSVIDGLWECVRDVVWNDMGAVNDSACLLEAFKTHGQEHGVGYRSLYPTQKYCTNEGCRRTAAGLALAKAEQRRALLFTLEEGTLPVWSVHLYCQACNINYHHNFSVKGGIRTYARALPKILQIGEHQFAEVKLINSWITLMVVGWVSATNCAKFYNTAISPNRGRDLAKEMDWQFKGEVTSDQVYNAFTALSLLEDSLRRDTQLQLPHTGDEKGRYTAAVELLNDRRRFYHPEVYHSCDLCSREHNGKHVQVVVIDGVTIGRPCCNVFNCKAPLPSVKNRYCKDHEVEFGNICCIKDCKSVRSDERKTCSLPEHQAVEDLYNDRGTARFQLQQQLQRAWVSHPESSHPDLAAALAGDPFTDELAEVTVTVETSADSKKKAAKIRGLFGRRRTHNEQLFVAPCGMIVARETFYGAEGIGSVIDMITRVYRIEGTMPEHIFFDNNCTLAKAVQNNPVFKKTKLTVDVFHFKSKHAVTDKFCQQNCNPAAHEEHSTSPLRRNNSYPTHFIWKWSSLSSEAPYLGAPGASQSFSTRKKSHSPSSKSTWPRANTSAPIT